jgi:hypothetical protein
MTRLEAFRKQGLAMACAITVGAVLIGAIHAPAVPVIVGVVLAFSYLVIRAVRKATGPPPESDSGDTRRDKDAG